MSVDQAARQRIVVRSPYSGEVVGSVPVSDAVDVASAVRVAKEALRARPLDGWERARVLDRAAQLVAAHAGELAKTISQESSKPIKSSRIEVARAQETFLFSAAAARELTGETIPFEATEAGKGKLGFTMRVPLGVVGAISPFNFPVNLVAHNLAPPSRPVAPWSSSPRARRR